MTVELFPRPEAVLKLVQRPAAAKHRAPRLRPKERRNILFAALISIALLLTPWMHHSGASNGSVAAGAMAGKAGHLTGKASPAAGQASHADAFHGNIPQSVTRWQPQVDKALADPRTAVSYKVRGNPAVQHMNILALPGQRSIVYNLMRLSGGNPAFDHGGRMGLLPMNLAQRLSAAHEMKLHYVTAGKTWPYSSLLLGIRSANDDLFNLMVNRRAQYQHDMCVLHDNGRGLILDFLSRWDPVMPPGQMRQFVNWYVQWGPKGLDPASLKQFCAGAK